MSRAGVGTPQNKRCLEVAGSRGATPCVFCEEAVRCVQRKSGEG